VGDCVHGDDPVAEEDRMKYVDHEDFVERGSMLLALVFPAAAQTADELAKQTQNQSRA